MLQTKPQAPIIVAPRDIVRLIGDEQVTVATITRAGRGFRVTGVNNKNNKPMTFPLSLVKEKVAEGAPAPVTAANDTAASKKVSKRTAKAKEAAAASGSVVKRTYYDRYKGLGTGHIDNDDKAARALRDMDLVAQRHLVAQAYTKLSTEDYTAQRLDVAKQVGEIEKWLEKKYGGMNNGLQSMSLRNRLRKIMALGVELV